MYDNCHKNILQTRRIISSLPNNKILKMMCVTHDQAMYDRGCRWLILLQLNSNCKPNNKNICSTPNVITGTVLVYLVTKIQFFPSCLVKTTCISIYEGKSVAVGENWPCTVYLYLFAPAFLLTLPIVIGEAPTWDHSIRVH